MSTFKAVILKSSDQVKRDGTSNVKIRITHNRKADYIPTDLYVVTTDIDNSSGVVNSGPNKEFINFRISSLINKYQEIDIKLGDRRNFMTVQQIKSHILTGAAVPKQIDFFSFCEQHIKTVTVPGTLEQYDFCVKRLKSFVGEKLPVNEITYNFLLRYEHFLRSQEVKNGIINYMRTFRALFNKCRDFYNDDDRGITMIPHYPFKKYTMPKRTSEAVDHALSLKEMRKFVTYQPQSPGEEFAKDMFLLMFYLIGIESKDLFYCGKAKKGRIEYQRFKTSRKFSIKIEPQALAIINKYKGEKLLLNASERFQLPKSFYRTINNHLSGDPSHDIKGIFPKIGIHSNVTSKWARHTWATIARNDCRIDKDDVALCLGHQDIDNRVTDMYIKYDYSIIDSSNRKVIDKVFSSVKSKV
jgi:site-specific recombinase XerD